LDEVDGSATTSTVMQGFPASGSTSLWDKTDERVAADWLGLQASADLKVYFERMENVIARDVQLCVAEVIIEGILESRGDTKDGEQEAKE
jgi:hypothetical protein